MIGLLWLVGIAIYVTSQYLYDHDFKALRGVSFEIQTGMFGLL